MATATASKPTPTDAPALIVRMPMKGIPARLVAVFGQLVNQFNGGDTLDTDPYETLFVASLAKRIREKKLNPTDVVGAYFSSIGQSDSCHRPITVQLSGSSTEVVLNRAGCSIKLAWKHGELTLHFEGTAKKLATIANADGDLGKSVKKAIWTTAEGQRSGDFNTAFTYWFEQCFEFDARQKLG